MSHYPRGDRHRKAAGVAPAEPKVKFDNTPMPWPAEYFELRTATPQSPLNGAGVVSRAPASGTRRRERKVSRED